ncbi:unnamed protein product [Ceutorhynchus assimilis]|uniref:tRNA-specific adenosine deaminase 1 n=1 Tax=Ceutorhynchus assimilis TaxID=467358 RepID=A0A9N9QM04_9CUCU|nr:unnamed protein product [Ceutorhynchus assimilis]
MDKLILDLCLKQFNKLPKTGKPTDKEWTVLSCLVQQQENSTFEVVALGTGSKCIGKSKMCPKGTILNDSHAEIMCRRAFIKYLYNNLQKESKIFCFNEATRKFALKPGVRFHFFSSQVPCGDAAICPKIEEDFVVKKRKIEDINRTGAKCIGQQDPKGCGQEYHLLGVVRTKPGRGDPTVSVSCSDKLAKWCYLGIQGSLLMNFLDEPIYLASMILLKNNNCNFSLERALYKRFSNVDLIGPYKKNVLIIYEVEEGEFKFAKADNKVACASSIAWCKNEPCEAAINGKRQGVTKKHLTSAKGRLTICKLELFKVFLSKLEGGDANMSYIEAKNLNKTYQDNWQRLKAKFGAWTVKDLKLLEFKQN